jgi:hypothetical protein
MGESDPVATCARKTVVVKYGGAAVERGRLLDGFLRDIAALRSAGIDLVVVHGGGPQISRLMEESGKTPRFVGGMRVTDDETMELVERALRQVNDEVARMINRHGTRAIGLGGGPGPLISREPPDARPAHRRVRRHGHRAVRRPMRAATASAAPTGRWSFGARAGGIGAGSQDPAIAPARSTGGPSAPTGLSSSSG